MSRPLPTPDPVTAPFWEAAARDELLLQSCADCQSLQFYPRAICLQCGSTDLGWTPSSGHGTIHSYTVNHRPAGDWNAGRVPYVVALVDLTDGPRMLANIDAPLSEIEIGKPVTVWFEELAPGVRLPQFRPTATTEGGNT